MLLLSDSCCVITAEKSGVAGGKGEGEKEKECTTEQIKAKVGKGHLTFWEFFLEAKTLVLDMVGNGRAT